MEASREILCPGTNREAREAAGKIVGAMKLAVNEEKARIVDAWQEAFDFHGILRLPPRPRHGRAPPRLVATVAAPGEPWKESHEPCPEDHLGDRSRPHHHEFLRPDS